MLSVIKQRRSIRKFKTTPIEQSKIDQLVQAALLSPSSRGIMPWIFIVVTQTDLLLKLAETKQHGSSFIGNAPLAIVVAADSTLSDMWVEDTSIASIIIQLTAESLGLGSCWVQIRNRPHDENQTAEDYVQSLLNIPTTIKVESIIAIGYKDQGLLPHAEDRLAYGKVQYL